MGFAELQRGIVSAVGYYHLVDSTPDENPPSPGNPF